MKKIIYLVVTLLFTTQTFAQNKSIIKYAKDHNIPEKNVKGITEYEKSIGFVWIEDLVAELEKYETQRDMYPTLESYVPVLVKAYDTFAQKMPEYMKAEVK